MGDATSWGAARTGGSADEPLGGDGGGDGGGDSGSGGEWRRLGESDGGGGERRRGEMASRMLLSEPAMRPFAEPRRPCDGRREVPRDSGVALRLLPSLPPAEMRLRTLPLQLLVRLLRPLLRPEPRLLQLLLSRSFCELIGVPLGVPLRLLPLRLLPLGLRSSRFPEPPKKPPRRPAALCRRNAAMPSIASSPKLRLLLPSVAVVARRIGRSRGCSTRTPPPPSHPSSRPISSMIPTVPAAIASERSLSERRRRESSLEHLNTWETPPLDSRESSPPGMVQRARRLFDRVERLTDVVKSTAVPDRRMLLTRAAVARLRFALIKRRL